MAMIEPPQQKKEALSEKAFSRVFEIAFAELIARDGKGGAMKEFAKNLYTVFINRKMPDGDAAAALYNTDGEGGRMLKEGVEILSWIMGGSSYNQDNPDSTKMVKYLDPTLGGTGNKYVFINPEKGRLDIAQAFGRIEDKEHVERCAQLLSKAR